MSSNLKNGNCFKELLLAKLSYAVTCSVLSHVAVVFVYIFVVNFNVQPMEWFKLTFNTLTSFSTWLYIIPFASIIFAQIIICAKDYVLKSTYKLSRFQKLVSVFSARTFVLGLLHISVGGLSVWLYLSLSGGRYQDLYTKCKVKDYCLVEGSFFMILSGLWTSLYFFTQVYVADKNLIFPVVQQNKLLHFKAKFLPLLNDSKSAAFYPIIYYFSFYYICGPYIRDLFANSLKLHLKNEDVSFWLYGYTWIFAVLYMVNMNLMRFFFELFLMEPFEHPVMSVYDNNASLSEALLLNNLPILQHLACLDLYLLSQWSPQRRRALFMLSQPGGHPHVWNRLIQGALKLMIEFTDTLNKSTDILLEKEETPQNKEKYETLLHKTSTLLQSPLQSPQKYENMRNMSLLYPTEFTNVTETKSVRITSIIAEVITDTARNKLSDIYKSIRNIRTVKYVFGELPEAHIQHCLKNGQLIVWTAQGVANVVVASFNEDPYGIVQKDLPLLITTLVQLKLSVEKLNKVPEFSRKGPGFDDFSFKMKNSVNSAVKRSLCNICRTFGKYLHNIPLKRDITAQLQCYL